MKSFRVLVVAALALAGCSTGAIDRGWPYLSEPGAAARIDEHPLRERQVDLYWLLRSELAARGRPVVERGEATVAGALIVSDNRRTALDQMIAAVDEVDRREALRNDVTSALISASTANCNVYLGSVRSGQVSARLASDFFAGAFATAASLATPPASADILAGLSALSTSQGASWDRNVFAEQGAELVAEAIVQLRAEKRLAIEAKMSRSYTDYPLGLALTDLYEFHGDCSMRRGFGRMREAVLAREQTVQAIRQAAAAVQRSNGSAEEVVAVLTALDRTDGEVPATAAVSAVVTDTDLARLNREGEACVNATVTALSPAGSKDVDATLAARPEVAAACKVTAGWSGEFQRRALAAVAARKAAIVAATTALEAAKAAATAAPADQSKQDAASQAQAALNAEVAAIRTTYTTRAGEFVDQNRAAREQLLRLLAEWPQERPASELKPAISGLGGASLVSATAGESDPVFSLALSAVDAAIAQTREFSADRVAHQARSAALAYMTEPS